MLACNEGGLDVVRDLLAAKADPNARDSKVWHTLLFGQASYLCTCLQGRTALHLVLDIARYFSDKSQLILSLLMAGCDPEAKDDQVCYFVRAVLRATAVDLICLRHG